MKHKLFTHIKINYTSQIMSYSRQPTLHILLRFLQYKAASKTGTDSKKRPKTGLYKAVWTELHLALDSSWLLSILSSVPAVVAFSFSIGLSLAMLFVLVGSGTYMFSYRTSLNSICLCELPLLYIQFQRGLQAVMKSPSFVGFRYR